jgi:hypothetical protein
MNNYSLWAQAALVFPTTAVVVIDTTGITKDADILRVYVATEQGPIYDQLFWSERHRISNERFTGIPEDILLEQPVLPEEWEHLRATLSSHYILSYNLDFVLERLNENAAHYHCEPFHLIGDDVQEIAVKYFQSGYNLKLVDACAKIGHSMPTPAMAPDRARGIFALLRAMAAGAWDETPDLDLDSHPF